MAVLYPRAFSASLAAGFDGIFDWDFLKPAWAPTNVEPMDFDAVIERNFQFLCFETKDKGVPIKKGQRLALERLAMTGIWTVIVLRAKSAPAIEGWEVWYRGRGTGRLMKEYLDGNADDLVAFVRRWFVKVSEVA